MTERTKLPDRERKMHVLLHELSAVMEVWAKLQRDGRASKHTEAAAISVVREINSVLDTSDREGG